MKHVVTLRPSDRISKHSVVRGPHPTPSRSRRGSGAPPLRINNPPRHVEASDGVGGLIGSDDTTALMSTHTFLLFALLFLTPPLANAAQPFDLEEATIADLQQRLTSCKDTARSLTQKYLARIEALDRHGPALHSVIELNPDALVIADRLDAERKTRGARGPLHGIPVLLKDNIATADHMATSAGSLALAGSTVSRDAFTVQRLREAGAVILGKTNLSEWANLRSTHSTSGWSGRGGQTRSPYALDRNPSGSSSGSSGAAGRPGSGDAEPGRHCPDHCRSDNGCPCRTACVGHCDRAACDCRGSDRGQFAGRRTAAG